MLEFLRRRVFPFAVWCGVMGTAGWLWTGLHSGSARGHVEGVAYDVTSLAPGRIASVAVLPGQQVRAGQLIAMLDERELDAELHTLDAQRLLVEAKLRATAAQTQREVGVATRGIEESVDSTERARQQARAERSVGAAQLAALNTQIDAVRDLVEKRMADGRDLAELAVEQAALRKQIEVADGLIRELDAQAVSARGRRGDLPADATVQATEPLRAELAIIRTQQDLLALRKQSLELRAPGPGVVSAVHLQAGEFAPAGAIVASITGPAMVAPGGMSIVFVCMTEAESAQIRVGEAVTLAPPGGSDAALSGHVQRLAPAVAQLPERCAKDPRLPMWGRAVYVAIEDAVTLLPGQTFMIEFTGRLSDKAPASSESGPANSVLPDPPAKLGPDGQPSTPARPLHTDPIELLVPTSVLGITRFEPSAILWSEARGRYLVVSDDTGLEKTSEHAPWLFTMDENGTVDPAPIRLAGIEALSDLEAIAAAPDGGFYLLASQSRSRKGKRSAARQFFGHVAISATEASVTDSVALATLIDSADAGMLASLGLADTNGLDLEGMTATRDGGLLIGRKAPLDEQQHAVIWQMAHPDRLLATGELAQAGLTTWARVALPIRADGKALSGGIAELLELPDGKLLVAATAAGPTEPTTQDGALFVIDGQTGAPSPTLVRSFAGLKPEGLARNRVGDAVAVVFDLGDRTPLWMEQPWPAG